LDPHIKLSILTNDRHSQSLAPVGTAIKSEKVAIWTVMPNHYQASFFDALRELGVDLKVCYYDHVHLDRLQMGWNPYQQLPYGEQFVSSTISALDSIPDWRQRVHVIPGCGNAFVRKLAVHLSKERTPWVHWSEPSHPGLRSVFSFCRKRRYAKRVNQFALGAFGIGNAALRDFVVWGMRPERLALLPYSAPTSDQNVAGDIPCESFRRGRPAFIFLGSLCPRKGIDVLLRAFASLVRRNADWVLLLVGDDRSNGVYARHVEALNLQDRVFFRGVLPANLLSTGLKSAKVLVLPSRFDGWGVVLNEAASMGLALIASDQVGAAVHLIARGENGFCVKAGSAESLAEAMNAYTQSPGLAEQHGKHSTRVVQDFSPNRNALRFMRALSSWQAMAGQIAEL
jgi:glycosyltransferase involved in cell wall biosynthesis